jgi:hypothetical protein
MQRPWNRPDKMSYNLGYAPDRFYSPPLTFATIKGVIKNADNIKRLVPYLGQNVIYTLATPLLLGIGFMIA